MTKKNILFDYNKKIYQQDFKQIYNIYDDIDFILKKYHYDHFFELKNLYIVGSYAANTAHEKSDIDVLITYKNLDDNNKQHIIPDYLAQQLKAIQKKYKKLAILWNDIEKVERFKNYNINYFPVICKEDIVLKNYWCDKYNLASTFPLTTLVLLIYKDRPDWKMDEFVNLSINTPSKIIMNAPPIPHWRNKNKTLYVQNIPIDKRYRKIYNNIIKNNEQK